MRIIDSEADFDRALLDIEAAFARWAGAPETGWRSAFAGGRAGGVAFSADDEIDIFLERGPRRATLGVALTRRDRDLLYVGFDPRDPAGGLDRAAMALDAQRSPYLLISAAALRAQSVLDPFRRLAGQPNLKRAELEHGGSYLLIGPLDQPGGPEALLAVAMLAPDFAKAFQALPAPLIQAAWSGPLYAPAPGLLRARPARLRATQALRSRLRSAGFQIEAWRAGPIPATFAARRGETRLAVEVRGDAEAEETYAAIGRLALAAPAAGGMRRALALPAPGDAAAGVERVIEPGLRELGVLTLFYDFRGEEVRFRPLFAPEDTPADLRRAFADSWALAGSGGEG